MPSSNAGSARTRGRAPAAPRSPGARAALPPRSTACDKRQPLGQCPEDRPPQVDTSSQSPVRLRYTTLAARPEALIWRPTPSMGCTDSLRPGLSLLARPYDRFSDSARLLTSCVPCRATTPKIRCRADGRVAALVLRYRAGRPIRYLYPLESRSFERPADDRASGSHCRLRPPAGRPRCSLSRVSPCPRLLPRRP